MTFHCGLEIDTCLHYLCVQSYLYGFKASYGMKTDTPSSVHKTLSALTGNQLNARSNLEISCDK